MMKNQKRQVDKLVQLLREGVPGVRVDVDAPSKVTGSWFIDVSKGEQSLVIEYRPKLGFGITSTPTDGYGEGPHEFRGGAKEAAKRVVGLLRSRQRTKPQRVELLKQLREGRGVSQVELAELLGIKQPTVSKMERRDDVNVSTLRRFVEAMGGQLKVTAEFRDQLVEIGLGNEKAS
jgi:DNA-binding XRE family transcriptional regulator